MARENPALPEKDWPEIRKRKAAAKTAWSYYEHLVKTMQQELGEEKSAEILEKFMRGNARRFFKPALKDLGLRARMPGPWRVISNWPRETSSVIRLSWRKSNQGK